MSIVIEVLLCDGLLFPGGFGGSRIKLLLFFTPRREQSVEEEIIHEFQMSTLLMKNAGLALTHNRGKNETENK